MKNKVDKEISPFQGKTRTVLEWLKEVKTLYDPEKVTILDGRLVIIGLTMIDQELRQFIDDNAPQFIEILKSEGQRYWGNQFEELLLEPPKIETPPPGPEPQPQPGQEPPPTILENDPAVQHDDSPAHKDNLGRSGFADALAIWINRLWDKNRAEHDKNRADQGQAEGNSFVMNIYGPWGSGKTSLLNLLKASLQSPLLGQPQIAEKAQGWIVVEFNAWQHQHLTPVWWPLLDKVYKSVVAQLLEKFCQPWKARKIRLWEYSWRLFIGRKLYLFSLLGCALAFVLLLTLFPQSTGQGSGHAGGQNASNFVSDKPLSVSFIAKIVAILGAIWSGILALTRSLLPGSISSAEMFQQFTRDPLEKVKKHYLSLLNQFDYPVMVFIDDLDRCQTNYVVNLLEGIQTLFNSFKVFYVIAADRRWLHKCFETEYRALADSVVQPGCSMGHLFLEKIFQLAVPVPRLSHHYQKLYLDYLIRGDNLNLKLEEARQAAKKDFAGASSQEEIIDQLKSRTVDDPIQDQARREVAIRYSASRKVEASTEYYLGKFAHLLEPNPRAMKRLVTAYGVYRALAIHEDFNLLGTEEKRDQFVLWVILKLRWQLLEEYLMKNPDKINDLHSYYGPKKKITALPVELQPFAEDKDVRLFITDEIGCKLDMVALNSLFRLKE
jgi:preprotein translocase subunit SecG